MLSFMTKAKYYVIRVLTFLVTAFVFVFMASSAAAPYIIGVATGSHALGAVVFATFRISTPGATRKINKYLCAKVLTVDSYLSRQLVALEIFLENRRNKRYNAGFAVICRI